MNGEICFWDVFSSSESELIATVPFALQLRPVWSSDPAQVFFGVVEPGSKSRRAIALKLERFKSPHALNVRNPIPQMLRVDVRDDPDGSQIVEFELDAPTMPSRIETTVELSSDGLPTLEIPVHAFVREVSKRDNQAGTSAD